MKTFLVNYANARFSDRQKRNSRTGYEVGGFDSVLSFGPRDIDTRFARSHRKILGQARGNGYWLWKPYFVARALAAAEPGDFVFYCDSGAYFCDSISPLIELARETGKDILGFNQMRIESDWTKRDAFVKMACDEPRYTETRQFLSGYILWRKCDAAEHFVAEWLRYSQDEAILTDAANRCGKPNYPGFQEHRHDQSVYSLLAKRYDVPAHRDPSEWGNVFERYYEQSTFGQLIESGKVHNAEAD